MRRAQLETLAVYLHVFHGGDCHQQKDEQWTALTRVAKSFRSVVRLRPLPTRSKSTLDCLARISSPHPLASICLRCRNSGQRGATPAACGRVTTPAGICHPPETRRTTQTRPPCHRVEASDAPGVSFARKLRALCQGPSWIAAEIDSQRQTPHAGRRSTACWVRARTCCSHLFT